jgi:hypothetical protein
MKGLVRLKRNVRFYRKIVLRESRLSHVKIF